MQELVAAQGRLEMTQKAYLPATYYTPCGNPHQSPADVNTIAAQACSKRPDQGGALCLFAARKEYIKKDYAFPRQFNEKPSSIPGCPGCLFLC